MMNRTACYITFITLCLSCRGEEAVYWESNQLHGTGEAPLPYRVAAFSPKLQFDKPVDIEAVPGSEEYCVLEQRGGLWSFVEGDNQKRLVAKLALPESEKGNGHLQCYNIVFAPRFPEDERAWIAVNHRTKENTGINQIFQVGSRLDENGELHLDWDSRRLLLSWGSRGHDGCDLQFSPSVELLYISTGDGSPPADPDNVGQKADNLLGSILRLDVSDQAGLWRIPSDNPYRGNPETPDEVWAYGLRNPWRMSFHPESGELFLGDNGDEHWELVRRIGRATNHGWSAFEGSAPFRLGNVLGGPTPSLTLPVQQHPHTEMRSVIGGFFYRGKALPKLRGQYVYGCYITGRIWSFRWDNGAANDARKIAATVPKLVSFAEDHGRELLAVSYDGLIFRIVKNESPGSLKPLPATLSATGLFADTPSLRPNPGVVRYELNAPAWHDGAEAVRHMAVANRETPINIRKGDQLKKSWEFPEGSAFAQTFSFGGKRIETRVIHQSSGEWKFLAYRWRDDQIDADLADENGAMVTLPAAKDSPALNHRIPSRAECAACHTQRSFFVLGLRTEQLDKLIESEAGKINQLDELVSRYPTWFREADVKRWKRPPAWPNLFDPEVSLELRARTYLAVNCAHCHRESGLGGRAEFQLLSGLTLEETRMLGAKPVAGLTGGPDARIILPGHPNKSELLGRMKVRGNGQMPLFDSNVIDEKGVDLISKWIASLVAEPGDRSVKFAE